METIWKYPTPQETPFILSMPEGAEVLCVQVQGGQPCLWARVTPEHPKRERLFRLVGTGMSLPEDAARYLGTFQAPPEDPSAPDQTIYVFHVYEASRLLWRSEE